MSLKELMLFMQDNWVLGYTVSTVLVVSGYLVYSLLLIRSCRKIKYDVGVSGMIPFWNIIVLIKRIVKGAQSKKVIDEENIVF